MSKAVKNPANSLRAFLSVLIVVLILGVGAGFYYAYQQIRAFAVTVSHSAVDAEASEKQIDELQQLKKQLAEREALVAKAEKLFSTPDSYQGQALIDVQNYARAYGLTIANTSFEPTTEGSNDHIFVINIQSPVEYTKLINFLEAIEGNLPKMQVTNISIGRQQGDQVSVESIKIKVSTR